MRGPNGEDCPKSTVLFPERGQTLSHRIGEPRPGTAASSTNCKVATNAARNMLYCYSYTITTDEVLTIKLTLFVAGVIIYRAHD